MRGMMIKAHIAIMALFILIGCSDANLPTSFGFSSQQFRPEVAQVFFDANGTVYPDAWNRVIGSKRLDESKSLLAAATPSEREWISQEEIRRIDALKRLFRGKKRIFILVHGFNISEADSSLAFDLVERRIAFNPDDAVVRVHWDGLTGEGVGIASIWFAAVGYSQVVGVKGLRRILELPENQDIYLISHSRGASVVLSALGNPPFAARFRASTEALPFLQKPYLQHAELSARRNRIYAIMLAPAVGFPDFWNAECEPAIGAKTTCTDPPTLPDPGPTAKCPDYRSFTTQLQSIRYTVNRGDSTLKKKAYKLSRSFNATDLGYDAEVGQRLSRCYSFTMKGHAILSPHQHAFTLYAQDPELAEMLTASGVKTHD